MIYSMTAFARSQSQNELGTLICEIRSINHRYLEMSLYLPEAFRFLEMPIRDTLRQLLRRGKIECNLRYQATNPTGFTVNSSLAQMFCAASEKVADLLNKEAILIATDILRFPGVIETKETDASSLQPFVLQLIENTAQELVAVRAREGLELKQLFLQRAELIRQELKKVEDSFSAVITQQTERLKKRFSEANLELDPLRLEQEMMLFAQKIDLTEEVERAKTHVEELKRVLQEGGAVGRRLDFLLQELNREANTLGSKSVDAGITHRAVEIKVLIEQIREQVQNVE